MKAGLQKDVLDFLPGPNLCSQVGNNVSIVLRAALMEKCKLQGGHLSGGDIDHVFDLVMDSEDLFPIYQEGHKTCTALKDNAQFTPVGPIKLLNFVAGAFCNDVIKDITRAHGLQNMELRRALIQSFADFLGSKINTDLQEQLYSSYKKLVLKHGKAMTPITITSSQDIIEAFAQSISRVKNTLPVDRRTVSFISFVVNDKMTRKVGTSHFGGGWIDEATVKDFITQLFSPTENKNFRQTILLRT